MFEHALTVGGPGTEHIQWVEIADFLGMCQREVEERVLARERALERKREAQVNGEIAGLLRGGGQ